MHDVIPTIALSQFARTRHVPDSEFSHFEHGTEAALIKLVRDSWHARKAGYRDGVVLVPVAPSGFFSSVATLKEGDVLFGSYKARKEGEEPRKSVKVLGGQKIAAKSCDIVLYRHDVLAENDERSCDADWEIISINASPTLETMPIPVGRSLQITFSYQVAQQPI